MGLFVLQKFNQFGDGPSSVADGILCFCRHLGKGKSVPFQRGKDGIVAKTSFPDFLSQNLTFYDSFKEMLLSVKNQSHNGTETGATVFCFLQFV